MEKRGPSKTTPMVPVGVERVLYAAARDPEFRARLRQDRDAAIIERGLILRPSELAMLRLIPAEQLEVSIDAMDTSPDNLKRRTFLGAVAASAAGLVAGQPLSGCGAVDGGSRPPDDYGPKSDAYQPRDQGGPSTDNNGPKSDAIPSPDAPEATRGIRPDQ